MTTRHLIAYTRTIGHAIYQPRIFLRNLVFANLFYIIMLYLNRRIRSVATKPVPGYNRKGLTVETVTRRPTGPSLVYSIMLQA